MDTALKQRLVGAAVLIALAVIFLPMLVKGPAPDSGVSDVSMDMPAAPDREMETRELPLVQPGAIPAGGAVGMDSRPVDDTSPAGEAGADAAGQVTPDTPAADAPALPATTAGGGYAVHFGAYASSKAAETVATLARESGLPAFTEATQLGSRPAWRVRIGPYATRAEAEIVRLRALEVRSDVPVRVVALDAASPAAAQPATAAVAPATEPRPEPAAKPEPKPAPAEPAKPVAAKPEPPAPRPAQKPEPAPAPSATAKVGFAVQLGAFSDAAEAEALRQRLGAAGFTAFTEQVQTDKGRLTRVSVGPALDRAEADRLNAQVKAKTGLSGFVRSHP